MKLSQAQSCESRKPGSHSLFGSPLPSLSLLPVTVLGAVWNGCGKKGRSCLVLSARTERIQGPATCGVTSRLSVGALLGQEIIFYPVC